MTNDAEVPPFRYTAAMANEIEARWQERWRRSGTFHAPNPTGPLADPDHPRAGAEKMYVLDMFPYPSGAGLHVGHPLGYIGTDSFGRFQADGRPQRAAHDGLRRVRSAGRAVRGPDRHPPADDHRGEHRGIPAPSCAGWAWATTSGARWRPSDVAFYRWTQWIFLQLFNSWYDPQRRSARPIEGLVAEFEPTAEAHAGRPPLGRADRRRAPAPGHRRPSAGVRSEAPVNWCPGLGTVLADAEVTADGRSDRGNFPVFKRTMKQWLMRITAYGDRLAG